MSEKKKTGHRSRLDEANNRYGTRMSIIVLEEQKEHARKQKPNASRYISDLIQNDMDLGGQHDQERTRAGK